MPRGYFIRLGDKTECGGEVLEGDRRVIMNGVEHAREGDRVSCGKNGNVYEITGGIPSMISHGKHVAGTLDSYSTCPCRAQLIASSHKGSYQKRENHTPQTSRAATQPSAQSENLGTTKTQATESAPLATPDNATKFGRSFFILNSETRLPLAYRTFISTVEGQQAVGQTDEYGMARIEAPAQGSAIAIHVPFQSPARLLNELTMQPVVGNDFKTHTQAQELKADQPLGPITITVNDRAATREAIIRQVRMLGHEFMARSEWKAKQPQNALEGDWDYSMIALHHAGRSYSCSIGAKQMLETQAPHLDKYDDISYHFGIDCAGIIYEGRDIRFKASSVKLYNTGVIGIVLLNNLTTPEEGNDEVSFWRDTFLLKGLGIDSTNKIPQPQIDATIKLVTTLKNFFAIKQFGGHMEYPGQLGEGKICPGRVGMKLVKNIRTKTKLLKPPAPCKDC